MALAVFRTTTKQTNGQQMKRHFYNLNLRALLCQEDGQWAARALEMDLLGYGDSPKEALEDLRQAVFAQISFAHQKEDESLLLFRAGEEFFERWEEAQRSALRRGISDDAAIELKAIAEMISFTKEELKGLRGQRFKRTDLVCA